jgi:hypothetical protein
MPKVLPVSKYSARALTNNPSSESAADTKTAHGPHPPKPRQPRRTTTKAPNTGAQNKTGGFNTSANDTANAAKAHAHLRPVQSASSNHSSPKSASPKATLSGIIVPP